MAYRIPLRRLSSAGMFFLLLRVHAQETITFNSPFPEMPHQEITIPNPAAPQASFQVWLQKPEIGEHPPLLILLARWPEAAETQEVSPAIMQPEAAWFLRRGWAVATVMPPGLGRSTPIKYKPFPCGQPNLEHLGDQDAEPLRAVYDRLQSRPDLDASRTVILGFESGALAAIAFAHDPPSGVRALIAVSPAWPRVFLWPWACKNRQASTFGTLSGNQVPMLWITPEKHDGNAVRLYPPFLLAGGKGFLSTPSQPRHDDPTFLWGRSVQNFLQQASLPFHPASADLLSVRLPSGLNFHSEAFARSYANYLYGPTNKAFAVGVNGWSYSTGDLTPEIASKHALIGCNETTCKVVLHEDR